ncbi:MAG: hypothetical protein CM15mP116_11250 [Synechococcus sp.]|nr:MAG: hypothetical protein CM15mP116_11250 [Synechococcus sp.]
MIHNPESTEGLRNRTTITVWFLRMLVIPFERLSCGSCPILISGIGGAWSLGFISATIPFAAKAPADWHPLLSRSQKRS